MNKKSFVHDMVSKALFLYTYRRKKVFPLDGYDNDWLFLDDDLFCIWIDEYLADRTDLERFEREQAMRRLEDAD